MIFYPQKAIYNAGKWWKMMLARGGVVMVSLHSIYSSCAWARRVCSTRGEEMKVVVSGARSCKEAVWNVLPVEGRWE